MEEILGTDLLIFNLLKNVLRWSSYIALAVLELAMEIKLVSNGYRPFTLVPQMLELQACVTTSPADGHGGRHPAEMESLNPRSVPHQFKEP